MTAGTTRDPKGNYIDLVDRVGACFNNLLVPSAHPTRFVADATENHEEGGVTAEVCSSLTEL